MATKTYMPAVQRRIIVRRNPVYDIINYDIDNAYPQRVLELVRQSPTAKSCWGRKAKYLGGNGFKVPKLGDVIVNQKKGLTLDKLLKQIATDKALFPGFGLHVNYNANYKIVSVAHIKYEDIRQGDTDSDKYRGKYVIYRDWARKTWRSIYSAKFDVLDPFNPDPKVIKQQVIDAGGWDQYKGQLFYLTPVIDDYALCDFDAALEDIETEAGIKIFNNRQVKTGFMPSAMLFMKARREEADNDGLKDDDGMAGFSRRGGASQLEENLASFQGAEEAQKIIVVEYEGDQPGDIPKLEQYNIQNNDKLFVVTSANVEANIIKAWDIPKELISSDSKNGLSNGGEKLQAIREYNDLTGPERLEISNALQMVFANFYQPFPGNDWTILEVPTEGAGDNVVKYADKIQAILESSKLSYDNKINLLINIYGFKQEDADLMVPTDEFIKAAAPPVAIPQHSPLDQPIGTVDPDAKTTL